MPASSVLDTSVLIAHLRGSPVLLRAMELLQTGSARPGVVTVTHYEILRAAHPPEEASVQRLLGTLEAIPVSTELAREASRIWQELRADGYTIDIPDQFTAAAARLMGRPVLTLNARHFRLVRGLDVWDAREWI